jgi:pimeloyl-ACP methyl ester carboxylesterase
MSDLVLLHGALGARTQLDPLAEALQPAFHIHQLDFEGHGNAAPRGRTFRVQHFGENVIDLIDSLGLERVRLFGYSMGGYVAVHLAMTRPDRIDRVATLGTKFRWDPATAARDVARLNPDTIRAKVPRFADTLAARHDGAGGWERVLADTADLLRELGDNPLLTDATLAAITQPVRVIVGDQDTTVSVEESTTIARTLAAGSLTVLPDTPHPVEQVKVDVLARVLVEFLQ